MTVNPLIQELIAKKVLEANVEKEPSGRLSASRLGWPLQWQMLHTFKVPQPPLDEYTLRKFQRGTDVENRIVEWLAPTPQQKQVPCEYRGVVGFADVIMQYPIEIKSVTNRAFTYIQKEGSKRGHRLQAELYAKALGHSMYGVAYVASDDYRVLCFEYDVTNAVDEVIDEYENQVSLGEVPTFIAKEDWQGLAKYNIYPEWMKLSDEEIANKLDEMGYSITKPLGLNTITNVTNRQ